MNTIRKHFETLKQAEQYQNKLYNRYHHVRLVHSPLFTEDGTYVWEVKN
jgi:hypothetical protein